ncbi:UTRA domain-containing protein [Bacillus licheniformis]
MKAQGFKPKIKVVDLQKIKPSEKIQNRLGIDAEQMVYQVKRIRYADDEEIQFETAYIRTDLVPEVTEEMANISLYQCISRQGNNIKRTEEQIKIVISDEEIAQHLNITQGTPCFQISTQTFLASEEVVEYSMAYFRGDRVEFFIERDYGQRGNERVKSLIINADDFGFSRELTLESLKLSSTGCSHRLRLWSICKKRSMPLNSHGKIVNLEWAST